MQFNDKRQFSRLLEYSIRPGIDPTLLSFVESAEKLNEAGEGRYEVWVAVPGGFISGRILSAKEGLNKIASLWGISRLEAPDQTDQDNAEAIRAETEGIRERFMYLSNVSIVSGQVFISSVPFAQVKLSTVSAWGFGLLGQSSRLP